jgi:asparagine synthase (glutamine-hydrolysing)
LARRYVTVVLSGDGGDELFGGYETYLAQYKARQYSRLPAFLRKGLIEPAINYLRPTSLKKGVINKAKRFIEGLEQFEGLSHARWRIFANDNFRDKLFSGESLAQMKHSPNSHILNLFQRAGNRGDLNRSLYVDVKSYLVDNCLTKVDRMSMANSLETRVPFLDPELVTLAFQVPEKLKVTHKETKVILKKIASRHVPQECIFRPKEGFSIPIKNWLGTEFLPLMEELLNKRKLKEEGIFNETLIDRLKNEHLTGTANHSHTLWSLIVFQRWKNLWLETNVSSIPRTLTAN